jgi:hypothetical protein
MRKLSNFVAAVSLLLFVAAMLMWVRSYWRLDMLLIRLPGDCNIGFLSGRGGIRFQLLSQSPEPNAWRGDSRSGDQVFYPRASMNEVLGFSTYNGLSAAGPVWQRMITMPYPFVAGVCLAWPVTSLLLARRRRKGRGFAVEPAADAAPPAIDPPP